MGEYIQHLLIMTFVCDSTRNGTANMQRRKRLYVMFEVFNTLEYDQWLLLWRLIITTSIESNQSISLQRMYRVRKLIQTED